MTGRPFLIALAATLVTATPVWAVAAPRAAPVAVAKQRMIVLSDVEGGSG